MSSSGSTTHNSVHPGCPGNIDARTTLVRPHAYTRQELVDTLFGVHCPPQVERAKDEVLSCLCEDGNGTMTIRFASYVATIIGFSTSFFPSYKNIRFPENMAASLHDMPGRSRLRWSVSIGEPRSTRGGTYGPLFMVDGNKYFRSDAYDSRRKGDGTFLDAIDNHLFDLAYKAHENFAGIVGERRVAQDIWSSLSMHQKSEYTAQRMQCNTAQEMERRVEQMFVGIVCEKVVRLPAENGRRKKAAYAHIPAFLISLDIRSFRFHACVTPGSIYRDMQLARSPHSLVNLHRYAFLLLNSLRRGSTRAAQGFAAMSQCKAMDLATALCDAAVVPRSRIHESACELLRLLVSEDTDGAKRFLVSYLWGEKMMIVMLGCCVQPNATSPTPIVRRLDPMLTAEICRMVDTGNEDAEVQALCATGKLGLDLHPYRK